MSLDFAEALAASEVDLVLDWAAQCGIDPMVAAVLIQIHRDDDNMVPGKFSESGEPMRAIDWFMLHRGDDAMARYGHYLLRIHSYVMLELCEDPGQVAELKRIIATARAEHPDDP